MLQVRVSVPSFASGVEFTDPIILERAEEINLRKRVNSSEEGISFSFPKTDAKSQYIVYTRWWECWDTETNKRLNFGPFDSISDSSGEKIQVTGSGRASVLKDFIKSVQTFYMPASVFIDSLRYENMAAVPRTDTLIDKSNNSQYYGLSKRTKINAVDEQTGFIALNRDSPDRGTIKTDRFWTGTGKADWLTVDLGEPYYISKVRALFPWWGGVTIQNGRAYDWSLLTSNDNSSFTTRYTTGTGNEHTTDPRNSEYGQVLYFGESGFENDQITVSGTSISARYWKFDITDTHAWYGGSYSPSGPVDQWDYECGGVDIVGPPAREAPTDGTIPTKEISPENDCYASIVEIGLLRKIIGADTITSTSYKQIENDNLQITYYHEPTAGEMISTSSGTIKKFEPGGFFREVRLTWSGAGGGLNVKDEYNTIVYTGGTSGTNILIHLPALCRVIQIEGASSVQVTYCDAWLSKTDAFSFGGSYSYTTVTNDYAVLRFRGSSVKWIASIPSGVTAANVKIELRSMDNSGNWSSWSTLENSLTLPTNIRGEKVWEITEESGTLTVDTTYQLRITNLNGGYVSIDSFAGFWTGSFSIYNEDNGRYAFRKPTELIQRYDVRFSSGSIYEYATTYNPAQSLVFKGDRLVIYSRRGPNYGTLKIGLLIRAPNSPYDGTTVYIPGGDADGRLTVNLNNTTEIPQAIIFDSDDYFMSPGLPWNTYWVGIYTETGDPVYLDGMGVHEETGLSVKFIQTTHLDILKSIAEALQMEWDITESGIKVVPRLGTTTNVVLKEGTNTTIDIPTVQDIEQVATALHASGGDIDGLPLTTIVEDKVNRSIIGRTVNRLYDLRSVTDYFTLIGASRTELRKRRYPQRRITVSHTGPLPIEIGDDFIIKKWNYEGRVRAMYIERRQSSSGGTSYELECIEWPLIP